VATGSRRLISQRATGVIAHPQFGRLYRDVVTCRSWTIEEGMRAVQVWLPAMLWPVRVPGQSQPQQLWHDTVKRAYGHLRRYLMFHLTSAAAAGYTSAADIAAAAQAADKDLLEYAALVEQVRDVL
jgi:hypothetical protein